MNDKTTPKYLSVLIIICFIFINHTANSQNNNSEISDWKQYASVEEAGFSEIGIHQVKSYYDSLGSASLLVIYKGHFLLAYGDNTRRFMVHSIRKSFMSGLYGIYIDKGIIELDDDLKSLGIDDATQLTDVEKSATIRDLLSARSGVYLPSAYSTRNMERNLPVRGSQMPGSFWYYNNWDFNTLCTIFEKQTGNRFFEDFKRLIADRIGMEDFRIADGHYRYEKDKSEHPAYLFNMSARDMARFGLLYLNKGRWNEEQIISANWIEESTSVVSNDLGNFSNRQGYGYLWWVTNDFIGQKMYYASGSGGHRIMILPDSDLVIVHRVNSYEGKNVNERKIEILVKKILDAGKVKRKDVPSLIPYLPADRIPDHVALNNEIFNKYTGSYKHPFLGQFVIKNASSGPELATSIGSFKLFAIDDNHLFPEDLETTMEFMPAEGDHHQFTIEPVYDSNRNLVKGVFYY